MWAYLAVSQRHLEGWQTNCSILGRFPCFLVDVVILKNGAFFKNDPKK